jgi:hypothetical protein
MAETQRYCLGKEGGAFQFKTNPIATILLDDSGFFRGVVPRKNRGKN